MQIHARIQEFSSRGGGGGGPGPNDRKSPDVLFSFLYIYLVLSLFCRGSPMMASSKNTITELYFPIFQTIQHFTGGGG